MWLALSPLAASPADILKVLLKRLDYHNRYTHCARPYTTAELAINYLQSIWFLYAMVFDFIES